MKKIVLAIVVLLAIGGFFAFSHLGGAIKSIIESAGTQALGTAVHVGGVDASLATETASISGIAIDNPQGFAGKFLETKSIAATLGGVDRENKVVTIKEINVDGMALTYVLGPGGTNFDVLQKHVKSAPSTPQSGNKKAGGSAEGGYDVIIDQLKITDAKVTASIAGQEKTLTLPQIIINGIGSKSHPATPDQVAKQILAQVLAISSGAATKLGLKSLTDNLKGGNINTDKVKSQLNGLFAH